ncbi:hypothetical protein P9D43_11315 [Neobacillus niacini]|uniref:hypothetical protein n=1 Tax=Neobacillus niacini TaxID=86668 RepID=UPI00052F9D12|nr:hypothetical protein [Neobacillus niacini]KGM44800.1 hypothetical protein NP83_09500 [Neobacillus niacini]MEC1522601.1 hypothetical protein [Neobacillus niacini]
MRKANNDFVYVHMKAPDVKGKDNEPHEKVRSIELFDHMVGLIRQQLPENVYFALAADHSTPCEVGEHTGGLGNITGGDFVRT